MKSTKIFYGNQYVGSMKVTGERFTKWQIYRFLIARTVKRTLAVVAIMNIATWLVIGGVSYGQHAVLPVIVQADEVVREVDAPIMERIADCESGTRTKNGTAVKGSAKHFDPNTGQVFTKSNDNKTVDIGRYMINEFYHGKEATKLGYDLTKEEDNKKMAYYLYATQGTEPWVWSKSCWK